MIFTTPDGEQFDQKMANSLSLSGNLIILCGHFKGIDYRIREHLITKEISIGDYVLTGGELAAAVMADAIVRIIPGVISDEQSPFLILSRIICWRHLFILVRQNIRGGKYPRFCFQGTKRRLRNGNFNSRWNVLGDCVRICWKINLCCI